VAYVPEHIRRAASTYDASADCYDSSANAFWERFGKQTVARLDLREGATVLDACCGSGASALAAADAVGPSGRVIGVDVADRLLDLARAKSSVRGLTNVEWRCADALSDAAPGGPFDAVVCVFGLFFVEDMADAARALWRRVAPGGVLAVTTWSRGLFEPGNTIFWDAVRRERPDLHKAFNPWDRIGEPAALRSLLEAAGVPVVEVVEEPAVHPIGSPEDWWTLVMGSGYRGTVEQLAPDARGRVQRANVRAVREREMTDVNAGVLFATARRPLR
jgi:ubiquinone/menaquinone biosynthesis C-methylase UbiE